MHGLFDCLATNSFSLVPIIHDGSSFLFDYRCQLSQALLFPCLKTQYLHSVEGNKKALSIKSLDALVVSTVRDHRDADTKEKEKATIVPGTTSSILAKTQSGSKIMPTKPRKQSAGPGGGGALYQLNCVCWLDASFTLILSLLVFLLSFLWLFCLTEIPTPTLQAPWQLSMVLSSHLGRVCSIVLDPTQDMFATSSANCVIQV